MWLNSSLKKARSATIVWRAGTITTWPLCSAAQLCTA
jgi:hypothetical protein